MTRSTRRPAQSLLIALALGLSGCGGVINGVIKKSVLPDAMRWQDLEMSCTFGESAVGLIEPVGKKPAEVAMILGWLPAGVCAEIDAWEARRTEALIMKTHGGDPALKVAAATDAAYRADRAFALAARRYDTAYGYWESRYGDVEDCSSLSDKEQQVYLLGVLAGALSVVNDASAKGAVGVPQNRLLDAARATECLDDARFFYIPTAVRGAAWATIPGSGPEGVDAWDMVQDAAAKGDILGQSIPRALMAFTAANAGRDDILEDAILGFDELQPAVPKGAVADEDGNFDLTEWRLMDSYGWALSLYQADMVWIRAEGHRAPRLGELPKVADSGGDDPFGGDPFGDDPFGADDPFGGDDASAPDGSGDDNAANSSPDASETAPADPAQAPDTDSGDAP